MTPFTQGELTAAQAAQLNQLMRTAEQFNRLTVAAPLQLSRAAGIPVISAPGLADEEVIFAEVVSSSGTPAVHVCKQKTRDASNAIVDVSPQVTFSQVLTGTGATLANGTRVEIFPDPFFTSWWWTVPGPTGAAGGTITIEAVGGSPTYASISIVLFDPADGFSLSNPGGGATARVDMLAATASQNGVLSSTAQTIGGAKTFTLGSDSTTGVTGPSFGCPALTPVGNLQDIDNSAVGGTDGIGLSMSGYTVALDSSVHGLILRNTNGSGPTPSYQIVDNSSHTLKAGISTAFVVGGVTYTFVGGILISAV